MDPVLVRLGLLFLFVSVIGLYYVSFPEDNSQWASEWRPADSQVVALMRRQRVVLIGESTARQAFLCIKLWSLNDDCWIPSPADDSASKQIKEQAKNGDDPTSLSGPLLKHQVGVGELLFYPRPFYKNASDFLSAPRVQEALMAGSRKPASLIVLGVGLHDLLYQSSLEHQNAQLVAFFDKLSELIKAEVFPCPVLLLGLPTLTENALNPARRSVAHFRDPIAQRVSSQIAAFVERANADAGKPVLAFVAISDPSSSLDARPSVDGVHSTATAKFAAKAVLDHLRDSPRRQVFSSAGLALFASLVAVAVALWVRVQTWRPVDNDSGDGADREAPSETDGSIAKPKPTANPLLTLPLQNLTQIVLPLLLILFYLAFVDGPLRISSSTLKIESFDALLAIMAVLLAASALWGVKDLGEEKQPGQHLLNRHQTEEWKGLMMVCFLCYHIFRTEQIYNLIRVMVGAFVFLTGFGNAAFFMKCRDFSPGRIIRVFLRINFFVLLVCAVVDVPYIFYYVCALHTWSFLIVYLTFLPTAFLDAAKPATPTFLLASVGCSALCAALLFDTELGHAFFSNVLFRPLRLVLSAPADATLFAEWFFRSHLDYLAVYFGMLTALFAPRYAELIALIDGLPDRQTRAVARAAIVTACFAAAAFWWRQWGSIENKFDYNRLHTYWEYIPMLAYLAVRNLFSEARRRVFTPFQSLGTITLELYVMQCHTWMSDATKSQLVIVHGFPILNFVLTSGIMWYLSQFAFDATTVVIAHLAPSSASPGKILLNIGACLLVFLLFFGGLALL